MVCRSHPGNRCRENVAEPAGTSRPGMPAVQCSRGMESPANGIFFSCRAPLMAGRRRQETRCGRPRALPPPALPKGGVRRGGSNVPERFRRWRGRMSRFGSERAAGCSLRGKGAMSGKRQDLICGLASTPAPARPVLAEAGSACVVARIEPGLPERAPDGALAPSPGNGSEAPAGPEARGPVIPKRARSRRRVPCGRRTETACRGRPVRAPGTFRRRAEGGSGARRPGGTARGSKRHAETMVCVSIQGARDGFSGGRFYSR